MNADDPTSGWTNCREQWDGLDSERHSGLDRKREHCSLTIPSLLPYEGKTFSSALEVPYSNVPAEGINALASRIMSVVFPLTGQSVFELIVRTAHNPEGEDTSDMDEQFYLFEQFIMDQLAPTNLRSATQLIYRHLLAVGDCLLYMSDDMTFRVFRADQYVMVREHEGDWREILVKEYVDPRLHPELPTGGQSAADAQAPAWSAFQKFEPLFTKVIKRPDGTVEIRQEWRDEWVDKAVVEEVSPWMPLRWTGVAGEAYGISHVEDSFGDIRCLDGLSKALIDGAALNAEYRWGVNPNGFTEMQDLLDSMNGDYVPAMPNDVFPIQFQNAAQIQTTLAAVTYYEQKIGRRFLMNSAAQPQAERVTARQVSLIAQELEGQLGGVLSMAAREIQEPVIRRTVHILFKKGLLPEFIVKEIETAGGVIALRMRAGLEILNREAEREKLDGAMERMRNLPPQALEVFEWTEIARDWWQSLGLTTKGRVKTKEGLAQEKAAAQAQAMAMQQAQMAAQQGMQAQAQQGQQQQQPLPQGAE
jgi:hypothetical protein